MVSGRRQVFELTKAGKDRQQAAEIIQALYEDRRGDIALAVRALNKRPASWRSRLRRELAKLPVDLKAARALIERGLS
jgi:hypothetical protein